MTAIDTTQFQSPAARPFGVIAKISKLAFPLMVGSIAAAGLHVIKTAILTHSGDQAALYTLSMVQPAFIFMLAFLEALAITNQVFSSKSVTGWAKGDVPAATRIFSRIGLVLTALLAAGFYGTSGLVANSFPTLSDMLPYAALFVLSLAPYLLFELRNGALRGQGRTGLALVPFAVLIVVDIAVTWVGVMRFDLGFYAVLIGNAAGPLVALPLVAYLLHREIGGAERGDATDFKKHMIGLSIGVAGPVFASMFAGSASAAAIFPALAAIGQDFASGFLVIVRVRILFIIPAIAVGSAIAILVNQMPEKGGYDEKRAILRTGVLAVFAIYIFATAAVFLMRHDLVNLVVSAENPALFAVTENLMVLLIPTFFTIAGFTMLQVILEHLGLGIRVLIITIVSEVATIGLVLVALSQGQSLESLTWVMNGIALVTFIVLAAVFFSFTRNMGKSDAV